jgi:HEAT repeat protein
LEAAISLQWIGTKASDAIPALAKALQEDESEKVRERAAIVLQGLGDHVKNVVPVIDLASKKDKSIHVREAADKTLTKIAEKLGFETKEKLLKACKNTK